MLDRHEAGLSAIISCKLNALDKSINMSLEQLITILADGEFHSGDELGQLLGVSRTAVWKQIKKLEAYQLPLKSVKGKGYILPGGLDLLSEVGVQDGLSEQAQQAIGRVEVFQLIGSTNQYAISKAQSRQKGYVCTAEQQTAGRGRRGKPWISPYGGNLYFSLVWEFAGGASSLEGLSLAVGVALVNALEEVGVSGAELKWPNDILFDGRKLAGVLLEMVGDAQGPCQVVIGVGVNVRMPEHAAKAIDQSWVDIAAICPQLPSRNNLLSVILNRIVEMLILFEKEGFAGYQQRWQELDAYAGREVAITLGQEIVLGKALGVDVSGAIRLETQQGLRSFNGGEVSLRLSAK